MSSPLKQAIVNGMVDTAHLCAVRACERREGRDPGPVDACPPAPSKAARAAKMLGHLIEDENGMSLDALLVRACEADGHPEEEDRYAALFGAMLMHMALGTGLSWFDDHKRFGLSVPPAKFGYAGSEEYRRGKARASAVEIVVVTVEEAPKANPVTLSSQRFLDPATVKAKRKAKKYTVHYVNVTAKNGTTYRVVVDGHHRLAAARADKKLPRFVHDTKAQRTADRLGARYFIDHKKDAPWYNVATGRAVKVSA